MYCQKSKVITSIAVCHVCDRGKKEWISESKDNFLQVEVHLGLKTCMTNY